MAQITGKIEACIRTQVSCVVIYGGHVGDVGCDLVVCNLRLGVVVLGPLSVHAVTVNDHHDPCPKYAILGWAVRQQA